MTFQILLIVLFQWATIRCQYNLYDTDEGFKSHPFQHDCLNYHIRREKLAFQDVSDVVDDIIPYCIRPTTDFHKSIQGNLHPDPQRLSFEDLRMDNINTLQLLSWSMSIEIVERYQFYLNKPDPVLNEQIYNCTPPRFGLKCQYSFGLGVGMHFNDIVEAAFHGKVDYPQSSDTIVQVPCYVLLECYRNGQPWCLDWREVCDGIVDCFNEGLDEKHCFDMEVNECSEDEYRCHNGLCVSKELWDDDAANTDCLDRSDEPFDTSYVPSCFQDPTFRCEEHSCRADMNPFSCGDGQCVSKFQNCHNGRHVLLIESVAVKGELKDECWMAMSCLTKLVNKIDGKLCDVWLENNDTASSALEKCESFFQFPTVPVHSNHIRFFYQDPHLKLDDDLFLIPDYFCYNEQLCDSFTPDFVFESQVCLNGTDWMPTWDVVDYSWNELMMYVGIHFHACFVSYDQFQSQINYANYSSLYKCQDSSKMISKRRIMDNIQDCSEEDDENYSSSCELNDRYRITCLKETICWSPLVKNQACKLNDIKDPRKARFENICDGIHESYRDSQGHQYSDEFGCGNWSCSNIYTRCDGFWACIDGHDEENCGSSICPSRTFACVSPDDYTVSCLNWTFVNNGNTDCLGALDEQAPCRRSFDDLSKGIFKRFRCSHEWECLEVSQLCNKENDCWFSADDEDFCQKQELNCDPNVPNKRLDMEVLCQLNQEANRSTKYFAVHTSPNYPLLEESLPSEFICRAENQRSSKDKKSLQSPKNNWPWYCNRGLVLYNSIQNNIRTCACPPSYYGDRCQYQNQRISLTIRLTSNDRHATYAIISMLIDDNNEQQQIHAFDQSVYIAKESCSIKLNRYLLFPTRPKETHKNYSVRIDVFDKNAITYMGSWHYSIAFLFLPVNRLSIAFDLSNHVLQTSINCSKHCIHGECMKYINKDKYFCRCFPAWSGIQCNIPIKSNRCAGNSTSVGSICICPINQFGPRCSLNSQCPINACQNHGQCVPADITMPNNSYTCMCSEQYFGRNCECRKATLAVSLRNLGIPSYLIAYFFTLSNKSEPIETTVLRKLTLFQHTVTFHIAAPFQLAFIQVANRYYLASLQQSAKRHISTTINPKQQCIPVAGLLNATILALYAYQRIVYFHRLCQSDWYLKCFVDQDYLCLCTNEHHANCLKFHQQRNFTCLAKNYCRNDGTCLQDHPTCPSTKICLCPSCFFGNQCQFYAKGLGSTLDEILGYEIKRNTAFSKQSTAVKVAAGITLTLSVIGLVNSILAIMTFTRPKSQEVGAGRYLLASSITSLFTSIVLVFKFWFLFYSHQDSQDLENILKGNCFGIEPLSKFFLYLDTWLNACVGIERAITVLQNIRFNKPRSKTIAARVIGILILTLIVLSIPQWIYLQIFYDAMEERSWCVVTYVHWSATYSSILIFVHYFIPLAINICSIPYIMIISARQGQKSRTHRSFCRHLRIRICKNKHLIISSTMIICLTLPHLIISVILDCQKSTNRFWFYLIGYYLSFCPAAFVFVIFVLPTRLYRQEFGQYIADIRKRMRTRYGRSQAQTRLPKLEPKMRETPKSIETAPSN